MLLELVYLNFNRMVRKKNPNPKKKVGGKTKVMKRKLHIRQKKKMCLTKVIKQIKKHILHQKPDTMKDAIHIALKAANNFKEKIKPNQSRVVPIPKIGGVLPLIPIFAGLSALGTLSGGAAAIAKAVNDARSAKQQLNESQRHNKTMETIAMGKGMYLKPYKKGMGLFLKPYHK